MTTLDPGPALALPLTSAELLAAETPAASESLPALEIAEKRRSLADRVGAYVALTKPRIIELLLVTTVPTMILAQRGMPSLVLMVNTLVGGTLAAAGANTLNSYIDRDIDQLMHRTSRRPLVTGEIAPRQAITFGIVLGIIATIYLGVLVNPLSAVLAVAAILFYVFIYTLGLKRRTSQNIVWGGAAGCMPVLIGWAAVNNSLSWTPWVLFAIIFAWTPPHYWPLSMRYADDYNAAAVPMLGAIAAPAAVAKQVVIYTWGLVAVTLALIPIARTGPVYTIGSVVLGAVFVIESYLLLARARRNDGRIAPMRVFHWSITYLTLLFVAIAIDPFIPWR